MKENKNKVASPMGIMLTITNKGDSEEVIDYLRQNNIMHSIVMMAKGTNPSEIADIFTFGIDDRDILVTFIPTAEEERIVKELTDILGLDKNNLGLILILPINSASSNLLEKFDFIF